MDRNTEKRYDEGIYAFDVLKDEINRLEVELSSLQDRYDALETEKEDIYQQGYNDGANEAATDILNTI